MLGLFLSWELTNDQVKVVLSCFVFLEFLGEPSIGGDLVMGSLEVYFQLRCMGTNGSSLDTSVALGHWASFSGMDGDQLQEVSVCYGLWQVNQ